MKPQISNIQIGNQEWMSINLDIDVPGSVDNGIYGRLYTHSEALEAVKLYNLKHGTKWHLPANAEWKALADALGGWKVAGGKMKSKAGWEDDGNGTDELGLNMLPGGYYYTNNGSYYNKGTDGWWWSAESYGNWNLYYNATNLYGPYTDGSSNRFSVRCVKGICEEDRAQIDNSTSSAISRNGKRNGQFANWFEAKVKYMKVNEDGREKKVTESYLLDAMSYTEAESRIMHEMEPVIKGDYYITGLKKSNITELVESVDENDDRWYKAKIAIIDADEVSGKEKSSNQYYLVAAANINKALENLEKSLATFVVPYEIGSITDTQFMDVFPYLSDENKKLQDHIEPLSNVAPE